MWNSYSWKKKMLVLSVQYGINIFLLNIALYGMVWYDIVLCVQYGINIFLVNIVY